MISQNTGGSTHTAHTCFWDADTDGDFSFLEGGLSTVIFVPHLYDIAGLFFLRKFSTDFLIFFCSRGMEGKCAE